MAATIIISVLCAHLLCFAALYLLISFRLPERLGLEARYIMFSGTAALIFFGVAVAAAFSARSYARDLQIEMYAISVLVGGLAMLNASKALIVWNEGLGALAMTSPFQVTFYIYMSLLSAVSAPLIIWLVLRRLTDQLWAAATHDSLTRVLNRRGFDDALSRYFVQRNAWPIHLLLMDIDHFKRINDSHGHKTGDLALRHVADVVTHHLRKGDLVCRVGGEEFAVAALYRGKNAGRNRVESACGVQLAYRP